MPRPRGPEQLILSRVLVGVFMVIAIAIAIAIAPVILSFETLVEYFQSFLGYLTMPFVVALLGGIFWKRATKGGAFWTMVVMTPLGFLGFIAGEVLELHAVHFLYATGLMVLASSAVFVTISLRQPAPDREAIREVTFDRATWREESRVERRK